MAIAIREYLGHEGLQVEWNYQKPSSPIEVTEASIQQISPDSIMVDIEGIHVGPTRNFTWYTEEALKGSVPTWTKPYPRPLIMHHNETDGKIIGRVKFATYSDKNTRSGTGALLFTTNVPDKDGMEQIQDGRLNTVSIGAIIHDCRCSICGHNIAQEGECEHERGGTYDGKTCYWLIYSMEAKELSYVIVPSDIYAANIRIYKPTKADMQMAASLKGNEVFSVSEATKIDPSTGLPITESQVITENGEKPEAVQVPTPEGETPAETPDETEEIPEPTIEDLKAQVEALTISLEGTKIEKQTLEQEKADLEAKVQTATADLETTKQSLAQALVSAQNAQNVLVAKESELSAQISLRESLETQVIQLTENAKLNLIENVGLLRMSLGKPVVAKEELEKRSEESLKDAVKDLKEELNSGSLNTNTITPVISPAITENLEENSNIVKDKKNAGNIDLMEGLENVFSSIVGSRKSNL